MSGRPLDLWTYRSSEEGKGLNSYIWRFLGIEKTLRGPGLCEDTFLPEARHQLWDQDLWSWRDPKSPAKIHLKVKTNSLILHEIWWGSESKTVKRISNQTREQMVSEWWLPALGTGYKKLPCDALSKDLMRVFTVGVGSEEVEDLLLSPIPCLKAAKSLSTAFI